MEKVFAMAVLFQKMKQNASAKVSFFTNDGKALSFYNRNMNGAPHHDWYLREWLATLRVKQARLMELTDWDKRKTSELVNGKQRYNRDTVNEAAHALHIAPFELLMHPEDAMALRQLRRDALRIAAEQRREYRTQPDLDDLPDGDRRKAG